VFFQSGESINIKITHGWASDGGADSGRRAEGAMFNIQTVIIIITNVALPIFELSFIFGQGFIDTDADAAIASMKVTFFQGSLNGCIFSHDVILLCHVPSHCRQ
jgi:hypothetical protein